MLTEFKVDDEMSDPGMDAAVRWADAYAAACVDVVTATNACAEVANSAIRARNTAAQRPQHEISIRNFKKMAAGREQEFLLSIGLS